jgi:hypothetical protein
MVPQRAHKNGGHEQSGLNGGNWNKTGKTAFSPQTGCDTSDKEPSHASSQRAFHPNI